MDMAGRSAKIPGSAIIVVARTEKNMPLFVSLLDSMERADSWCRTSLLQKDVAKLDVHQVVNDGIVYMKTIQR